MSKQCQLCEAVTDLTPYDVSHAPSPQSLEICDTCHTALATPAEHAPHWQCLTTTMWSENPTVQAVAYRILKTLSDQSWAQDALDMLYLDDETREWADAGVISQSASTTRDSNGTLLQDGDTVTLIKDLPVKGAGFTAKRGTAVRGISLTDNPEHVEGRVNGQRIVLVAAFLKKST